MTVTTLESVRARPLPSSPLRPPTLRAASPEVARIQIATALEPSAYADLAALVTSPTAHGASSHDALAERGYATP